MENHNITMRKILSFLLPVILAACSTATRWEKAGADEAKTDQDRAECRKAAEQEAFRQGGAPFPYSGSWYGRPSTSALPPSVEADRLGTENKLAAFCMRSRGYELVRSPPKEK